MATLSSTLGLYIEDLDDLLYRGKNVLILSPRHYEYAVKESIISFLEKSEENQVFVIEAHSDCRDPYSFLKRYFSNDHSSVTIIQNFEGLLCKSGILFVDISCLDVELQLDWVKCVSEYSEVCNQRKTSERITFCLVLNIFPGLYVNESFIRLHMFENIDEFEFKYLINRKLLSQKSDFSITILEYLENLIFDLSYPNIELALHLIDSYDSILKEPISVLQKFISEYNHESGLADFQDPKGSSIDRIRVDNWKDLYCGLLFIKRGKVAKSILVDVYQSNFRRLDQVRWTAQVKVFFPLLEFARLRLIKYFLQTIRRRGITYKLNEIQLSLGVIRSDELEFSHLYLIVNRMQHELGFIKFKNLINTCRNMRNLLAHHQALNYDQILKLLKIHNHINRL